jgi:hypothetical protein
VQGNRANSKDSAEGRVWLRHQCELTTTCQPVAARGPDDPQWDARIRDISAGGIGLVVIRRFERGVSLAVEIPAEGDYVGDTLLARIVHVRAMPGEGWMLGCAFVSPLSEETVAKLVQLRQKLDAAQGLFSTDRNGSGTVVIPKVLWHDVDSGMHRISRRLFLTGTWPLPARRILRVWVETRDGDADYTRVLVHSCEQQGEDWCVRYSVLGEPSPTMTDWRPHN